MQRRRHDDKRSTGRNLTAWAFALAIAVVAILTALWLYPRIHDEHRTVTRRMGWQCTGISDPSDPRHPNVESAKFWFYDNPRFEEHESGPILCADLQNAPAGADVEMTFDTWGNTRLGLHGYDTIKLTINGKPSTLFGGESGGFHDDEPHHGNFSSAEDKRLHPDKYHFPPDTFRP